MSGEQRSSRAEPGRASFEEKRKRPSLRGDGGETRGRGRGGRAKTEYLIYEYVWKSLERAREADYGGYYPAKRSNVPKPLQRRARVALT